LTTIPCRWRLRHGTDNLRLPPVAHDAGLWAAEELGLAYEHVPPAADDPVLKQPEFLWINPDGTISAIVDDGFALAESLAINPYLAKKYGSDAAQPPYPSAIRQDVRLAGMRQAIGNTRSRPRMRRSVCSIGPWANATGWSRRTSPSEI
jgi:glutathione S-transferase